jgi:VWFA-related protein
LQAFEGNMLLRLLATAFLLTAALARSQAVQSPPVPAPLSGLSSTTIRQTVNNVLVDVVVSDKYGQPIKKLKQPQFQLCENGIPQQIAYFEEHESSPPPSTPPPVIQLPPNVYTNIANTTPDTSPTLVLLMDALNTPQSDQIKVRLAMLEYLRRIPQGRHIAIFTLTSKLHMLQGFNSDPATLIKALDEVAAWQKQSHLVDEAGQDSYADTMPKVFPAGATDVMANFIGHEQAWKADQRVGFTLDAFNSLATYLSALPGRKNLIWFSSSFPLGIGVDSVTPHGYDSASTATESLDRGRDYNSAVRKTSELLKSARVAVYPMDPSALATPSMFSTTQNNNDSLHTSSELIKQVNAESSSEIDSHSTMDTIAEATGGRAFHNTNDLAGAINAVTKLASNYYTIAYVPKNPTYDGKYRKLVLKVDEPRARLDYRRGYFSQDPDKSGISAIAHPSPTAAVLLHGAPASTDILFKVRVAPADDTVVNQKPGVIRYSINWSVDLRGLSLPAGANGIRRGGFELTAVAYNIDSKAISSVSTPVSLLLEPNEYARYLKTGLQFHQKLDLPVNKTSLRVAIVDTGTQRAGATEIPIDTRAESTQTSSAQPVTSH